jgi:uncharacterized protein YbaR (Trm112 family)/ubiquinone/menaquinone biosynthesis C-methylase UbiE
MHEYLIDLLLCPKCKSELSWRIAGREGDRIEHGEAVCQGCQEKYPIREGIGLFLTPDLPIEDLWKKSESNLTRIVRENPELGKRLLDSPLEALNPADQFFRAMVLEGRADYAGAETAEQMAIRALYTDEYRRCWQSQVDYLLAEVRDTADPVLDIASGQCYLVKQLAQHIDAPIIASDFSPKVMRRNRRWLEAIGLYDRVSLLVFDARQTPFIDGAIRTMTTNLGLPNIREAGNLFHELRRVLAGRFYAITHYYPEDSPNSAVIDRLSLGGMLYKDRLLGSMIDSGFQLSETSSCFGKAIPTPVGAIIEGAQIDGLPITETELEWCVVNAS